MTPDKNRVELLSDLPERAQEKYAESKKYFFRLKKKKPKHLDQLMHDLHDKEFEQTNCLNCANCCKTTSPIFTDRDIARIAKHLRLKEQLFISKYLKRDEDDFMVLQQAPCSFLDPADNRCLIYDVRPKACAEYPHTNRRRFVQITDLTLKNTQVCPAVFNIVETLKKQLPL